MGRVRTKTVKKAARVIIERYYTKLTLDFHTNKRICDDVAIIPSKKMRNKVAGCVHTLNFGIRQSINFHFCSYATHLMRRIEKGPVRNISIKLQEEERERRDNYMPDISVLDPLKQGYQLEVHIAMFFSLHSTLFLCRSIPTRRTCWRSWASTFRMRRR